MLNSIFLIWLTLCLFFAFFCFTFAVHYGVRVSWCGVLLLKVLSSELFDFFLRLLCISALNFMNSVDGFFVYFDETHCLLLFGLRTIFYLICFFLVCSEDVLVDLSVCRGYRPKDCVKECKCLVSRCQTVCCLSLSYLFFHH